MPATSLQQLKIPRGYRGDWPLQEYALIDAVEATINEIEVARGSNTSLAAELEETYATKTYVQLAIANPNVNDIYVSDLSVKVSEAGLVGYTLQVQPGSTLAFVNTYTLGNGTLADPAIKFNTSVSGGLFMSQNVSHETMNVKVSGGVALEIVHDKVSGANRLELGNFVAYSDGDIEATDATLRAIISTGTGAYATNLAEANIGVATVGTLNITSLETPTITTTDLSFSYFGTILVLDAQNLNTLPNKSLYARTTNTCTNTPEVSAGYLNHYWSGAGESRQTWVSSTTGYLYERVNNGAWTKYAKAGGDSSQTFEVATATLNTHAVTKLALDTAVSALGKDITDEATARAAADLLLDGAIDQEILDRGLAISTVSEYLSKGAVAQPITQVISSGSLNSQLTPGVYSFTNAVTGKPQSSGRGILLVFKDNDANEVVQLAVMLSLGLYGIATRHTTDGGIGAAWSDWRIPANRDGDAARAFNVADGTANTEAVSYGQLITATSGLGTTKAQARYTNTASNTVTFATNTNIGTVTRTADGWDVTFATSLPNANYVVVGTVTGAAGYGGRSFEPKDFTTTGFTIESQWGGDNSAGNNTHDGVIVNFVVY